jgi:hypothetical protein
VEEYYKSNTVQKGINFTVDVTDEEKKEIRCYVNTYIYHKYMAYDESEEITLFTISL